MSGDTELNVDNLIARLLEGNRSLKINNRRLALPCDYLFVLVRGCRPGKIVQMTEGEVRGLCLKSREIFLSQPILLELEAPLKICGKNIRCSLVRSLLRSTAFRWHPRSVHRFIAVVRIRRISPGIELFISWRLCRSWETIVGNNLSVACL